MNMASQERTEQLKQAQSIFIDAKNYSEHQLLCYYKLVKDIFASETISSRSITIYCLELVMADIEDCEILFQKYFCGLSFVDMARQMPKVTSAASARHAKSRALKELYNQQRKFYLPAGNQYLKRYALFLDAISAKIPTDNDLSVYEIGLPTRTANTLYNSKITTASQLYLMPAQQLANIPNLGPGGLREIKDAKSRLSISTC